MAAANDFVSDHVVGIAVISAGIFYVQKSQRRNATLLTVIGAFCCLACIVSLIFSLRGTCTDTRRLFVGLSVAAFSIYHVAPFLYLTTAFLDSLGRLIRSKSVNGAVDTEGVRRIVQDVAKKLARPRPGGLRAQFSERMASVRSSSVYILTSEVGSARHTESGGNLANSWLFKGNAKFQHWTIMVDGICYELGRLRNMKDGHYAYGIRTETVQQWQERRSIKSFGMAVMMSKYDAGFTNLRAEQIKAAATFIWKEDFKGTYVLNRQNCQNFAHRLLKRIRTQNPDTWGNLPKMLSKTYTRATRPVRIPWYIAKYSTIAVGYAIWIGASAVSEKCRHISPSTKSSYRDLSTQSSKAESINQNVRTAVSVENSSAYLIEEQEVLDAESAYFDGL